MATICFMVLGTYILYYKALLKVDTVIKIKSMSFITMLMLGVICLCHAILVILTAVMVDFKSSSQDDMNSKTNTFGATHEDNGRARCKLEVDLVG